MRLRSVCALVLAASGLACGASDEMRLVNRLELPIRLDVLAPRPDLVGGCDIDFRTRFCAEEYIPVGVIDMAPAEDRFLTLSDEVSDERCTHLLWLRLPWLGEVGPVLDPGTLFQLPTVAEVEAGAGALHSVAFPQATIRLDETGPSDLHQGPPPPSCASLGRPVR
jgi:hypothetical protein